MGKGKQAAPQTADLFRVCGDKFLVHLEKRERVTEGGIHLPERTEEKDLHGTVTAIVLAAGPGRLLESGEWALTVPAKPGDRLVLDSVHSTWWIRDHEGEKRYFVEARDVLAVWPGPDVAG